jgi:hypothetical protein
MQWNTISFMDLGAGEADAYGKSYAFARAGPFVHCHQQVTVDSIGAFEKLIEAYGKIGDMLPRLDRLGNALVNDHNFQSVLALVYSDIIEFHRRAYKFVRRKCELLLELRRPLLTIHSMGHIFWFYVGRF